MLSARKNKVAVRSDEFEAKDKMGQHESAQVLSAAILAEKQIRNNADLNTILVR